MFYCWALRVLLLWGHLARAGVGCWRGQCGTQHNPTLQDGGFQLGKGSHLGQAIKTPHTAEILRGFGILSPSTEGGDGTSTNSEVLL